MILKPFSMVKSACTRKPYLDGRHKIIFILMTLGRNMLAYYGNKPHKFEL